MQLNLGQIDDMRQIRTTGPAGGENTLVFSKVGPGRAAQGASRQWGLKYVRSGVEIYDFDCGRFELRAGDMLLVPPVSGFDGTVPKSQTTESVGICMAMGSQLISGEDDVIHTPIQLPAAAFAQTRHLRAAADRMEAAGLDREHAAQTFAPVAEQLDALGSEICAAAEALPGSKVGTRHRQYRLLERARAYLHDITDRPVGLPELSRVAGISAFQLARGFSLAFGEPPAGYHRRIRLEAARDALVVTREEAGTIALAYGFSDLSSFSRAFRRQFGYPPSAVRGR